ncbi:MAG TPA: hypothetical protein VHI71_06355 [Actinomycetota bacterium]|nr:hypothetical protein [Actinomycetota bacterium]
MPVYDVEVEVGRKVYHFGDKARIDVTVTRTDSGMPVDGAGVFAYIPYFKKDGLVAGWGETNATGDAVVHIKLRRKYLEPGPADLRVLGFKSVADTACAQVVEYGEARLDKAFRIEP